MKKICIIGGSGGIGSKVSQGLKTLSAYHNETGLGCLYEILPFSSKDLDIRNYRKCEEFFIENEFDILINFSGVNYDKFVHKLDNTDDWKINHMFDVNLHGSINVVSNVLPGMRDRGFGRIILISSVLSTKVVLGTAIYSSCKAFLDKFVQNVSAESIGRNVTVNSLQLGYFDGGLTYKVPNHDEVRKTIPLKRFGSIEELCSTIEFLINNEYLTGANIPLNGGLC